MKYLQVEFLGAQPVIYRRGGGCRNYVELRLRPRDRLFDFDPSLRRPLFEKYSSYAFGIEHPAIYDPVE